MAEIIFMHFEGCHKLQQIEDIRKTKDVENQHQRC